MSTYGLNNHGHYRGDQTNARDLVKLHTEHLRLRFQELAAELIEIIGEDAYDTWIDANWPAEGIVWSKAIELVEAELLSHECSCTPLTTCQGCLRKSKAGIQLLAADEHSSIPF